jgi:hypothetical protein
VTRALERQKCRIHPGREAVSRCPECRRFYCRECVTEHEGRLLCVQCLAVRTAPKAAAGGTRWILWIAAAALGFAFCFLWFYTAGYILQQLPPAWSRGADSE